MSPVAITNDRPRESTPPAQPFRPLPHDALNIARHPSPWHEIAHTLSATPSTSVSSRRGSSPTPHTTPLPITNQPKDSTSSPMISALSSSQALRDWEARIASPDSDVRRHQLIHPPSTSQLLIPVRGSPVLPPKLAAERDKEGHIEYKLKLIDPSVERFGKLVTQMMWRLKQGKNEAIYEIGLADDGTVVGLTRAEMDASLKTLEAMASELGATVMILREIVLSGAPPSTGSPSISEMSSSFVSTSSAQSVEHDSAWPVKRPDLDDFGRPKKGTRALSNHEIEKPKVVKRASRDVLPQYKARQVVFDISADPDEGDSDASIPSPSHATKETPHGFDDDIPPFELDLEDSVPPPGRRPKKKVVSEQMSIDPKKFDAKRAKLAKRREERRMDLLRGDGMSTTWLDTQPPSNPGLTSQLLAKIPHQPARPSSLRLASPAPSTSTIRPSNNEGDDDGSLWGLSETPLDSLSLSFADVQIQDVSPTTSPTTAPTGLGLELSNAVSRPITGKEMVCVEALVVRKVQHGHGVDGDGSEEEECGWGGQDDVWGLGVDSD